MDKAKIVIELEFNSILFKNDIEYEVSEWLKELKFRHLTNKKIISITE